MIVTRTRYLRINGIPLATDAWEIPDLSPLLDSPAIRGSDKVFPTAEGERALRRRRGSLVVTLPLDVFGDFDSDGTAITGHPLDQCMAHLDYLETALGLAYEVGDGTVPAVFYRGALSPVGADVHFLGFQGTSTPSDRSLRTTFDLKIPAARWEEVGS